MVNGRSGFLGQVGICFKQCIAGFKNEKGWKAFISVVIITIIIVCVMAENTFVLFYDTRNSAFALVCACIWIGIFSSIRSICRERDIVKHEHRTGLKIPSYIVARVLYEAIISVIDAFIIILIVRFALHSHFIKKGIFMFPSLELYVTFFLIIFSSDCLGLLISSIVKTENTAMTVMPFALIIQLVMSGAVFQLEGLADKISYLTISRWGLDAICAIANVNEMKEAVASSSLVSTEFAHTFSNLTTLWGILLLFAFIYIVLSIVVLELFIDK